MQANDSDLLMRNEPRPLPSDMHVGGNSNTHAFIEAVPANEGSSNPGLRASVMPYGAAGTTAYSLHVGEQVESQATSVLQRLGWSQRAWWLLFCGLNSILVYYLAFFFPYPLAEYYAAPLIGFFQFKFSNPGILLAAWMVVFQLYYIAFRASPIFAKRPVIFMIVGFPVLFSLIQLVTYPFGANDMFDYMFRGHMLGHLGVPMYGHVPNEFPGDPFLPYAWWKDVSGTYGPLWELMAGATSRIAGYSLWSNVIAYKLLILLHMWGSMALMWFTLRRWKPELALGGFVLFAWNPLVQFEFAGNAHNDGVLVFWLLAAVCLLVYQRYLLAVLALTVAVMLKFTPLLLLPLFLVALFHAHSRKPLPQRLAQLGIALAGIAGVAILSYLPFGLDRTIANIKDLGRYSNQVEASVPWLARQLLETGRGMSEADAQQLVHNVSFLLLALVVLWHTGRLFWHSLKTTDTKEIAGGVLERSYEIFFAYILLATFFFRPWYITWLLVFAPFLNRFGYAERTVALCFCSLANYFVIYYGWPWTYPTREQGQSALVQLEFLLPFLLTLAAWAWRLGLHLRDRNRALSAELEPNATAA